jgi:CRISPR system Cascade subunit CasD
MDEYLIFRLYGPMASWGDIAVGEVRPSYAHPSKSAVLGLIAAALGIRRNQELLHQKLTESYGFAVRVDRIGIPLVDYHTAQVPPSGTGRRRIEFLTRRDEILTLPKDKLSTILSKRDYRMDSLAAVALWAKNLPPFSLVKIGEALQYPTFTLYLGRKSCPLALPLEAQVVKADSVANAFLQARFAEFKELTQLSTLEQTAVYWEEGSVSGLQSQHTFERRDVPLSRKRWQFDVRKEFHAFYPKEE